MAKRSDGDFARRKNDLYETWDKRALTAILPHLKPNTNFIEPCAGNCALIRLLESKGHICTHAYDINPPEISDAEFFISMPKYNIEYADAINLKLNTNNIVITNPPWTRELLHPIIVNLSNQVPSWLLFDADWIHTKQSIPYLSRLRKIVSVGRLKWIQNTKMDGKDNVSWYLFDKPSNEPTIFYGRA